MSKILILPIIIFFSILNSVNTIELNNLNTTDYEKNLNSATELYLSEKEIPLDILVCLVPKDYSEFELYYGTTYPDHKMAQTGFFYETTQKIFEQVTSVKNNEFYLPSLKLISFADGEFAEEFIEYLELIIGMDKEKFCRAINGKEYVNHNPIKYYAELNKCE
ncbi:hypothetical protein [Ulvibacterium marinum]|uniref:hypothetical protein n=1 Tax=Ulvibacterium marinum TaxID=2419782 RepID=UPI0024944E9E|nr:hypothetical protein [Ulvibacterium marinum]